MGAGVTSLLQYLKTLITTNVIYWGKRSYVGKCEYFFIKKDKNILIYHK